MALDRFFPLSDWTQILIIRRFHHACRFPARVKSYFQLLTYHYIVRATLILLTLSFCRNPIILFYMSLINLSNWRPNSNLNKLKAMIMELLVKPVFGSQYFVLSNPFLPVVYQRKRERSLTEIFESSKSH